MDIIEVVTGNSGWVWVVAGAVLLALELVVPGGVFLWLGISGLITGVIALVQPIDWPWQFLIFGSLSLITIYAWLRYLGGKNVHSDSPLLNQRAERFVGQEVNLSAPIQNGIGAVALGDTVWRVAGPELAAGARVRIIGHSGAVLKVEAAN